MPPFLYSCTKFYTQIPISATPLLRLETDKHIILPKKFVFHQD
jgi:hypothetical protein